jgi:hypothetical protein
LAQSCPLDGGLSVTVNTCGVLSACTQ